MGLEMSQEIISDLTAPSQHKPKSSGFTLVELSIVLVIIGLISGAITTGMSLIKGAKVAKMVRGVETIKMQLNTFQLQYEYFPGDMPNANEWFPSCSSANGDGDGLIENKASNWPGAWSMTGREGFNMWAQLTCSGIESEIYSSGQTALSNGESHKATPIEGAYYGARSRCMKTTNAGECFNQVSNWITIGKWYSGGWGSYQTPAISANMAHSIDTKIDDGDPKYGNVLSTNSDIYQAGGYGCNDSSAIGGVDGKYYTNEDSSCVLNFMH
jgi:prepilin-type N-terminal cleavage/methylation domain-containing protein